ncbi:hypothetical protein [Azospirillum brasilense]|uniref:hypothetical protein n=1 Tax=Azospirillum brasilense TaxID=192 RepID=UPI001EDC3BE1|nr:hypothetical protein [Azospirillum brasilense]UKJ75453.1 hypothetical protein H1Q64_14465 [Azospirillum brasilense]
MQPNVQSSLPRTDLTRFSNGAFEMVLVTKAAPDEPFERTCERVYALMALFAGIPKEAPAGWTAHQHAQLRRTQDQLRRMVPRLVDQYVRVLAQHHQDRLRSLRRRRLVGHT